MTPCIARIVTAGRARAMEKFSTDRIIPQYEQYYKDVMGR